MSGLSTRTVAAVAEEQPGATAVAVVENGQSHGRLLGVEVEQAAGEEAPVGRVGGQLVGAPVRRGGLVAAVEAAQQVRAGGVQQVVAVEPVDPVDQRQPGSAGLVGHGDGDGVVERHHRRRRHRQQLGVQGGDARPVRLVGGGRLRVQGGDRACSWYGPGRPCRSARSSSPMASAISSRSHRVRSWSSSSTTSPVGL